MTEDPKPKTEENRQLFLIDTKLAAIEALAKKILAKTQELRRDAEDRLNGKDEGSETG